MTGYYSDSEIKKKSGEDNECAPLNGTAVTSTTDITSMKGGTIMTSTTNITRLDSTGDLLKLRRLDKRNRLHQRVEQLFGEVISPNFESDSTDDSITHAVIPPLTA